MTEQDNNQTKEWISASEARKQLRARLKASKAQNDIQNGLGTNQPNTEENIFSESDLKKFSLLAPPYDPVKLFRIVENGAMLGTCIETYKENIDGYGYEFRYLGDKQNEDSEEVQAERKMLQDFFAKVNETQSFKKLRKELRFDYEGTGNAFVEVVRFPTGQIATLYRADSRYIRLQKKQNEYQTIDVSFPRNGERRTIKVSKRFRKYAMVVNTVGGGNKSKRIRWFKEYGDPRKMDANTGRYENELGPNEQIEDEANELLHWKQGNDTYGIPRWAGILPVVLGVNKADYVNYDLFDSNAIPALAVLVSNGYLTQDSVNELGDIFEGKKGVENWHKFVILDAVSNSMDEGDVGDKPTRATIDLKELNKPEDAEFGSYISSSESRIRSKFRLPPIQVGQAEQYSRSVADASKLVSEEQVFIPEREDFDEFINFTLMDELGALNFKFKTIGPKMVDDETQVDAYAKLARGGALSVNDGIRIANKVLDLDMTEYSGEWAGLPVALVLELIKRGHIKEIDGVGLTSSSENDNEGNQDNSDDNPDQKALAPNLELDSISDDISELNEKIDSVYSLISNLEIDNSGFE